MLGEKIRLLRTEKGLTQEKLAERLNMTKTGISYWENEKTVPSIEVLERLANIFDINISYLVDNEVTLEKKVKTNDFTKLPIYKDVSCGFGSFVDDEIVDYYHIPTTMTKLNKEYFCQYAVGDSMKQANINDGDLLVFDKTNVIEDNQIGCFCIGEEHAICKRFRKSQNGYILVSANDDYLPIFVNETNCFRVVGKLAFILSVVNQ